MSGKKYALTTRLWLPDVSIDIDEDSNDQSQILLKEYISALPMNEQEEYSKAVTIRMVRFHNLGCIYSRLVVSRWNGGYPHSNGTSSS
jgi:hypothetical protein